MKQAAYYEGRVHSVKFRDDSEAFFILKMKLEGMDEMQTVRGNIPGISVEVNSYIPFMAQWHRHEKYGKQLRIIRAPVFQNSMDPEAAIKLLVGQGVGESTLYMVRLHFGNDHEFLEALADLSKLHEVDGLSKLVAAQIADRWNSVRALFQTIQYLSDLGISPGKVRQAWRIFGDKAEETLANNPWALVRVQGVTFQQADEVARRLNLPLNDPQRVQGAVLYAMRTNTSFGHTYMSTGQLYGLTQSYISDVDKKDFAAALGVLHKENLLVIDRESRKGTTAIYEPFAYQVERDSARLLQERTVDADLEHNAEGTHEYLEKLAAFGPETEEAAKEGDLAHTVDVVVQEWASHSKISLSDKQKEGVRNALQHPVSVLTGLPGTGKTTSLKAAVRVLQDAEVRFLLCAPTGIAAKRLSSMTGADAFTIHRAFGAQGSSTESRESTYAGIVGSSEGATSSEDKSEWRYNGNNFHPAQVVIIDEASMVDQHLLYRLLDGTNPSCRLVFVGDHAQLPSVGPGNVLRELIQSDLFPVVKLTEIFRQEDTSDIVYAAHDIHKGEVPSITTKGDFALVQTDSDSKAMEVVCTLANRLFEGNQRATDPEDKVDFQILSPRHAGEVGVTKLNERLRELLNPQAPNRTEVRLGNGMMREDDRIMIIKNDYQLDVYNGDVGKIRYVDLKNKQIEVKIFDSPPRFVHVELAKAKNIIRMAYACTVHKAQGLEYDWIIMPVVDSFHHQLQRNLLYTAVTRAKKRVVLVGTASALEKAVRNAKEDDRNTLFLDRLKK